MSRNQRAAAIGIGLLALVVLPAPDASIVVQDRIQAATCYPLVPESFSSPSPTADVVVHIRPDVGIIRVRRSVGVIRVRPDVGAVEV